MPLVHRPNNTASLPRIHNIPASGVVYVFNPSGGPQTWLVGAAHLPTFRVLLDNMQPKPVLKQGA